MIKRATMILLALAMVLSMTACGNGKEIKGSSADIADDTVVVVVGGETDSPQEFTAADVRKLVYIECLVYGMDPSQLKDEYLDYFFSIYSEGLADMVMIQRYCEENEIEALPENSEEEFAEFYGQVESNETSAATMKTYGITKDDLYNYYYRCYCQLKLSEEAENGIQDLDSEVQAYYDEHMAEYVTAETTCTVYHILVDDEATAQEVLTKLENGGDFQELAKEYSKDGSASQGGLLGTYTESNCGWVDEFKEAAFAMKAGQISEPVKSEFGYHIIYVSDRVEAGTKKTLDEVKSEVTDAVKKDAYNDRIDELVQIYGQEIYYKYEGSMDLTGAGGSGAASSGTGAAQ